MKLRNGLVLVMALGFGVTGCASGGGGGGGGGGDVMANLGGAGAGINPRDTDNTRAAEDALDAAENAASEAEASTHYQQAATAAQAAITEDSQNPLAHRLAAMAAMGLGDYEAASGHFDQAEELRPLYEFDFVGIREAAWIDLYQQATPHVQSGNYEAAAEYFEDANAIYQGRPEAMVTLGQIYAQLGEHDKAVDNMDAALAFMESDDVAQMDSATVAGWQESVADLPLLRAQVLAASGRYEEAVGTYRELAADNPGDVELQRGLAAILMEMGNEAEATQIYTDMLTMDGLTSADLFSIGVGFYQSNDYVQAGNAFGAAAEASVNDRDAIEMWARSLQLAENNAAIPPIAERWIELDPNSQNAYLILARAENESGDGAAAGATIGEFDALEVTVNDLQLRRFPSGGASVAGSLVNKRLSAGASVNIRFTFYDASGSPLGSVTESVSAGQTDMATVFEVQFDSAEPVHGYGYEIVG